MMLYLTNYLLPTDTAEHAIGDVLGSPFLLRGLTDPRQSTYVVSVQIFNWLDTTPDLRLHIYDGPLTVPADNAVLVFQEAQSKAAAFHYLIDIVAADYKQAGTGLKIATKDPLLLPLIFSNRGVFGLVENRSVMTPAATEKIGIRVGGHYVER